MKKYEIKLLQTPMTTIDQVPVSIPYKRAEGLWYYLCVQKRVSRDEAAALFWAECDVSSARRNLRDALYKLRRAVGNEAFLLDGNHTICLNPEADIRIDIDQLTEETILTSYTGDFLGCFYIRNCLEFENWSETLRDQYRAMYLRAVKKKLHQCMEQDRPEDIPVLVEYLFQRNEFDEELIEEILNFYRESGRYSLAEVLYWHYAERLEKSMEDTPGPELTSAFQRLEAQKQKQRKIQKEQEPFLCRSYQLQKIQTELHRFLLGEPHCSVLISGEAGVGKTALLRQIRRRSSGAAVLETSCTQTQAELYFKPWYEMFRQLQKKLKQKGRWDQFHTQPYFQLLFSLDFFQERPEMIMEAIKDFFQEGYCGEPVLLLLDDLQWMDSFSLRLLSEILTDCRQNVLVIGAVRNDSALPDRFLSSCLANGVLTEVKLMPFSLDETREVAGFLLPELRGREDALEKIYRSTGGNALFLRELLQVLAEQGDPSSLSLRTAPIIRSRLIHLSSEEERLLAILSYFDEPAEMEPIQKLFGSDGWAVFDALESLQQKRLIQELTVDSLCRYTFCHQLVRDYVYDNQSEGRRKAGHRRLGEYCWNRYQHTQEVDMCRAAARHLKKGGEEYLACYCRLEYLERHFTCFHEIYPVLLPNENTRTMQVRENVDVGELEELERQIGSGKFSGEQAAALRIRLFYIVGRYAISAGDYVRGKENIERGLALAEQHQDTRYQFRLALQMIFWGIQTADSDFMETYLRYCRERINDGAFSEGDACIVLRLSALCQIQQKQFSQAEVILLEAIRRLAKVCREDSSYVVSLTACYGYLGDCQMAKGKPEEARLYYRKAVEATGQQYMVGAMGIFYSNWAYASIQLGDWPDAESCLNKARSYFQASHIQSGLERLECYCALLALHAGNLEEARNCWLRAWDVNRRIGNPQSARLLDQVKEQLAGQNRPSPE